MTSARRLTIAASSALALAASQFAATEVSGRAQPPEPRRHAASLALSRARDGQAGAWAASELRRANALWRRAEDAHRREDARLVPWRDYNAAGALYWRAELAAWGALTEGMARRAAARDHAEQALADAGRMLDDARRLAAELGPGPLARLARARLDHAQAGTLHADGRFVAAAERAAAAADAVRDELRVALRIARRYAEAEQLAEWRTWVEETRAWSQRTGRAAVVVLKEKNELLLLEAGVVTRTFAADVGANALARKLSRGDRATPEGRYRIVQKKGRGQSRFYKALLLDYPNATDRARLRRAVAERRLPANARPGSLIEIHGDGGRGIDWTDGCVALANPDLDELFPRVGVGTPVTIVGGDGRDGKFSALLARHAEAAREP